MLTINKKCAFRSISVKKDVLIPNLFGYKYVL